MAIRAPIIPTDIVVHLGAPDEAAKNITVPFQEYIKNVASGEIYPNWPLDSLKSNVLAQISFALNRIYNEWYRSKGYDFDITSSPVYDQSFGENRQFFERTSQVVDDLFNDYIVKNEQVQPLFAQYCDGRVTTCEGLSQWGTVSLANQGKSPVEILKYYYGDDIKLIYNAPVEANIMTYPGFPVKLGTAGNFVRMLKIQLNRISDNYPAIPKITDDNAYFNVETENSVKKFQEIFDLPQTGIVDKSTWYKIKYIYNAVKKIADIYSEGITMDEAMLLFNKTLQYGDNGEYLRALNYYLNVISYFDQDIPFLDLAGNDFTNDTKEAVISFQTKYDLVANGIVDANTWRVLRDVYQQTLRSIPKQYLSNLDEFFPGIYLSRGMTGDEVLTLQEFLYIICERKGDIPGVRVTGTYDSLTEQSVKAIQRKFSLRENGIVGPSTWYRIVEYSKE